LGLRRPKLRRSAKRSQRILCDRIRGEATSLVAKRARAVQICGHKARPLT
jgi:hypothetical protein